MDIILIGSGNVATVVGRKMLSAGHRIVQVFSRHLPHAEILARRVAAEPIATLAAMDKKAGMVLVAIPDDAYQPFVHEIPLTDSFLVHTAGSVPMDVFKHTSERYGVLYPLQSLRRTADRIPEFPLLIDANEPANLRVLEEVAITLSKSVIHAGDEPRLKYHLGAVLAGNFVNHLFALTESWCVREEIAFALLEPLIQETVYRMQSGSPGDLQTGPAIRNDSGTIQKHQELLKQYPELAALYEVLTRSIQAFHDIR